MYYRKDSGYTIDNNGKIIRWDNPRRHEDEEKIQELEFQLQELRQRVQQLETEQKMMKMEMNEGRAVSFDVEYQGAIDKVKNIKKEIDAIFKG